MRKSFPLVLVLLASTSFAEQRGTQPTATSTNTGRPAPAPTPTPSPTLTVRPAPTPTITNPNIRIQPPAPQNGNVTDVKVSGFASPGAAGQIDVAGSGKCRFHAQIFDLGKPGSANDPKNFNKVFSDAINLPVSIKDIPGYPNGTYRAYLISYDDKLCTIQGPNKNAGGWYVDFKVGPGVSQNNNGQGNNGGGNPPPNNGGGGGGNNGAKPANGSIASMQVPGGSFAEDEAQKLQVNGKGGCAFDLQITNKSYGGNYDQTWPVGPKKLDSGSTLYNGTDFGTLAQGSYHAQSTGKNGCTGTAGIDFKVTEKTSTKKVTGKPTIGFDQQPKGAGGAFSKSKDSNIWFKVTVPQSIKDEQYASCCDIEFDYMNEYGGWEPLPNSPFNDSSFGLAITQQAGVVPKSVSGFTQGTQWRVKVRGYKYKVEFEWSDWVQFKVDQN